MKWILSILGGPIRGVECIVASTGRSAKFATALGAAAAVKDFDGTAVLEESLCSPGPGRRGGASRISSGSEATRSSYFGVRVLFSLY